MKKISSAHRPPIHCPIPDLLTIGLLAGLLSGCASLAPLTGQSFTLEGQLPADFAIKAQAHYSVANGCDGRSQTRSFQRDFEDAPHAPDECCCFPFPGGNRRNVPLLRLER